MRCSYRGCREKDPRGAVSGRCPRHGKWTACKNHHPPTWVLEERHSTEPATSVGYYPPASRPKPFCPVCRWEDDQANAAARRVSEAEVERRNAEELRKHPDPPDPVPGWITEFRSQGYSPEAAEALAAKRLRENPLKRPSRRHWTLDDLYNEQRDAERQHKLDAGEFGICPVCNRDVLVSQGIVLKHGYHDTEWVGSYEMGSWHDHGWKMCPGEGSPTAHAG